MFPALNLLSSVAFLLLLSSFLVWLNEQ